MADVVRLGEDVTLYHGDCLEVLPTLEAGSVDAVVTDPPYCSGAISEAQRTRSDGQGLRSETLRRFGWFTGDNMGTAGLIWLLRTIGVISRDAVKSTGSLLVFMDWRMVPNIVPAIESAGLRYQDLVVWDKGSFGLGTGFRRQHELIAHFTYGNPEYYNRAIGNVIKCGRVANREHQTEKPAPLLQQLVGVVCPIGGTTLDPFAGSGTTGVACIQTGRKFIGIEIDRGYFDIAVKRITEAQMQMRLPLQEKDE